MSDAGGPAPESADAAGADGGGTDAERWLRLTLDPERLAVIGQLAAGPRSATGIAAATGRQERTVLAAPGALVSAGFAEVHGPRYHLVVDRLRALASAMRSGGRGDTGAQVAT